MPPIILLAVQGAITSIGAKELLFPAVRGAIKLMVIWLMVMFATFNIATKALCNTLLRNRKESFSLCSMLMQMETFINDNNNQIII